MWVFYYHGVTINIYGACDTFITPFKLGYGSANQLPPRGFLEF